MQRVLCWLLGHEWSRFRVMWPAVLLGMEEPMPTLRMCRRCRRQEWEMRA